MRRHVLVVVCAAAALLVISSLVGAATRPPAPRNVVLIGWDGCQRNHLKEMIAAGQVPNLTALAAKGKLVAIDVVRTTDTKSGWTQILTGCEPEVTGVFSNNRFQPIPVGYTVFERLEEFFGPDKIYTAAVIGKKNHVGNAPPSADGTIPGEPYYLAQSHMDLFVNALGEADSVGARALQVLDERGKDRFLLFVHFAEPDHPGHAAGENSPEYTASVQHDDEWLGRIEAKLKELGVRNQTLIYVTADHGFDEGMKSHADAPYVFLATDDPLVMRRGLREDITPTILWRFGVNLGTLRPRLDGHPLQQGHTPPMW